MGVTAEDAITGQDILFSCTYPKNSNIEHLFVGALWVGAIVGRDTLVSTGIEDFYCANEFWPNPWFDPSGFKVMSIDPFSPYYSEEADSEQDIICEYTDTETNPLITNLCFHDQRPHRPLQLRVRQRSMAWSFDYADDFIILDYQIKNIGSEQLKDAYLGIWFDCDILHVAPGEYAGYTDDIVGFYRTTPASYGCGFIDTVNIAYQADNDGDPAGDAWDEKSPRSIIGVRVIRTPSDQLEYSFNWWVTNYSDPTLDFGPRQKPINEDPWRDLGNGLGTPLIDEDRYYLLKHNEFDYDLLYVAVDHSDSGRGWLPPPEYAADMADGFGDMRTLLSCGPFDIDPGESLPITLAWVGGENFHLDPANLQSFNPYYPTTFYNKLNFDSVAANARWASWIYDNPGVDTDGDGWAGKRRICCGDTAGYYIDYLADTTDIPDYDSRFCDMMWYQGDGVPDFRGASPPPPPTTRIETGVGRLILRFNGLPSETTPDYFTGLIDFEGYRVYISRDDRLSSFSVQASYDREDYNKYVYLAARETFLVLDAPFSRSELQMLYGDPLGISDFDPLIYDQDHVYTHPDFPDSVFYFASQDFNCSEFGVATPIRKSYPEQEYPSSLNPYEARRDELTEDGYLKYFEYEILIDNLLPTVAYYVSVTAFDFGCPEYGIKALESPVLNSMKVAYPLASTDEIAEKQLKVFVYPNPYRGDVDYEGLGYENRDGTLAPDRMHRIHFANLPPVCTIYIYSLDGDLIRRLEHNYPEGGPEAMHEEWNMITRNTQLVETGLYYWVVESEEGTQIGKLVIIK
ncbi:MAG: hypothetical protein JSV52_05300 [Candidatus Zixiibacteriota bacterium]|nr:MAG: hypothetical protein JSV52_05300 [candidate division Zixibacteria bacterium]